MSDVCIFCGAVPQSNRGPHHILPKAVRKTMCWTGNMAKAAMAQYSIPLCGSCHVKVTQLQEPLVKLIKYLRGSPPVPVEFQFIMDGAYKRLMQKTGEDSVDEG